MTPKHSHAHHHDATIELNKEPRFEPGTRVRLNRALIEKYKRRPEYAEDVDGVVEQVRGAYLPPTTTDETKEEYLYSVRFHPRQIWGSDHPEENGNVYIDIWEDALDER
jgi:hypothetical protein